MNQNETISKPLVKSLGPKAADGVKDLLARERAEILSKCTECGRCFEVCPMVQYGPGLAGKSSAAVVHGVLDILRDQPGSPEALEWVKLCTKSGECDAHCPEPISPKMMLRLARIIAIGGLGDSAQLPIKDDPDYFNKIHAYARLSLTEDEHRAWTVAPVKRPGGTKP